MKSIEYILNQATNKEIQLKEKIDHATMSLWLLAMINRCIKAQGMAKRKRLFNIELARAKLAN